MVDFFSRPPRHEIQEIPIAPILDMMVAVIFFLLLSTTFVSLTQQSLPPAVLQAAGLASSVVPRNPKLYSLRTGRGVRLLLRWTGKDADQLYRDIDVSNPAEFSQPLLKASKELITTFKQRFPGEKSLQLGFGPSLVYQEVVSIMDGVQSIMPDVVLLSYEEAAAFERLSN